MQIFILNAYGYGEINDKFPYNSYVGDKDATLLSIDNVINNPESGIARIEVVLDLNHKNARVGQAIIADDNLEQMWPVCPRCNLQKHNGSCLVATRDFVNKVKELLAVFDMRVDDLGNVTFREEETSQAKPIEIINKLKTAVGGRL